MQIYLVNYTSPVGIASLIAKTILSACNLGALKSLGHNFGWICHSWPDCASPGHLVAHSLEPSKSPQVRICQGVLLAACVIICLAKLRRLAGSDLSGDAI